MHLVQGDGSRAVDSAVIVDTDACASYTGATMAKEGQQSDKSRIEVHASSVSKAHVQPRLVPDIEELKKSVSVDEIRKQGFKAKLPRTIEIVPSTDHSGESSLDVIVVFPKNLRDEDVTSAQTSKMLSWIQDTILSKPESGGRWPYVFVKVDSKDACSRLSSELLEEARSLAKTQMILP